MDIYEEIALEYEKIRNQNDTAHKRLMEKVYMTSPRIKEIDETCSSICQDYCRRVMNGQISAEAAADKMKKEMVSGYPSSNVLQIFMLAI